MTDREHIRSLCEHFLRISRWADGWTQREKDEPAPTKETLERRDFCRRYLERA